MRFSELDGRSVVLWGLGRETTAFQSQLQKRLPAAKVSAVIDDATAPVDALALIKQADVLVRSPGVSIYKPVIREAMAGGVPVTTPTALWLAERGGAHVIGVTGTKGKSTTATILTHLLRHVTDVQLAGNIGLPVIELLDLATQPETWVVLELSSYQISDLDTGPEVAVITNLYKEHTDWHRTESRYRADKLRLFSLPGVEAAVYPLGDSEIEAAISRMPTRIPFEDPAGWYVDKSGAVRNGSDVILTPDQIPLRGRHNAANVAVALAAIEAARLPSPSLPDALQGLEPLPHRLQTVVSSHDQEWVDDSISTTPESTSAALDAFIDRPVVLIAGGADRGQDYSDLAIQITSRPHETHVVLLPDTGPRLGHALATHGHPEDRMSNAGDMRDATLKAATHAQPGAIVLLSPAAPSFNAYENFERRGEDFTACARALAALP